MGAPARTASLTCREGGEADREYMLGLAERTFVDFGDYRSIIDQWLDAPRVTSLLLVEAGVRVGFAIVAQHRGLGFWSRVSAELVAIALDPAAQGRGLGAVLLRAAEDEARRFDAHEMCLHTATENHVARSFFATAGYGLREGRSSHYPNGQPALELRRSLHDQGRAERRSSR